MSAQVKKILRKAPPGKEGKKRNFFNKLSNIFLFLGIIFILFSLGPLIYQEIFFQIKEIKNQTFTLNKTDSTVEDSPFARLISTKPINLVPKSREFGLVIERIGVNVPVVKDVSVNDKEAYKEALKNGVAHAMVSDYPSEEPGNVYIFAHASLNFWRLGKYATVFNLLRHMRVGDTIHVFYEGDDYVYKVVNSQVYKGFNTYAITRPVLEPLLTLQTCDPPGTTLNRLVVTAKLVEVK